jgi:diaminopimelate epimerase
MGAGGVLRLTKHHGAGNDFLVLLDPDDLRPLSAPEVRALCDRHRGFGADGVVRAITGSGSAALSMDLRNADGGVAEMSGNGIRCLVQAAVDAQLVAPGTVAVQTLGGLRSVEYRLGPVAGLGYARVWMGHALLGPAITVDEPDGVRWGQRVDLGNPHVVLFGRPVEDDALRSVGPPLERSVPGGANVEFVWPGPAPGELTLRVWERGVGETLACGTGACAAAAAAHAHGEAGSRVRVHSPGGSLDVELEEGGILLAGPTQKVGEVTVDEVVLALLANEPEATVADTTVADTTAPGDHAQADRGPVGRPDGLSTEVATRQ